MMVFNATALYFTLEKGALDPNKGAGMNQHFYSLKSAKHLVRSIRRKTQARATLHKQMAL